MLSIRVRAAACASVGVPASLDTLKELSDIIGKFEAALHVLEDRNAALAWAPGEEGLLASAREAQHTVIPAMEELRRWADKLETRVADDLWPLPSYLEMLFMK